MTAANEEKKKIISFTLVFKLAATWNGTNWARIRVDLDNLGGNPLGPSRPVPVFCACASDRIVARRWGATIIIIIIIIMIRTYNNIYIIILYVYTVPGRTHALLIRRMRLYLICAYKRAAPKVKEQRLNSSMCEVRARPMQTTPYIITIII